MAQSTITDITALFRTQLADMPKISTHDEKPSYTSLKKFQTAIDENAMAVPSYTTDLGHLALVISEEDFRAANDDEAFEPPTNPGTQPAAPPTTGATRDATENAVAILPFTAAETIRSFNQNQQEYIKYRTTRTALKNQILNSVDDKYVSKLKHPRTKYATVTPLELLTHLWTTYGTIDQSDQTANELRMKAPWNPPAAIETLFEQLQDGQSFAERGNETISDEQLVRWGYENILATGLFDRDCSKWRKKTSDKTWTDFQAFFLVAEDDRSKNATTTEATYTANQVQQLIQQELAAFISQEEPQQENIPPPQEQANAVSAQDIKKMIDDAINQRPPPPRQPFRPRNGRNGRNTPTPKALKAQALLNGYPVSYCWTHGVTRNLEHTSESCTRCAEGHQKDATYDNRKGGSDRTNQIRKN
jgi:hypothetical protein